MAKKTYKLPLYDQVIESIALFAFAQTDEYMAYFCDVANLMLRRRAKMATKEKNRERAEELRSWANALNLLARTMRKER